MIFRSPKLLKLCQLIPCQNCGADDGTVCAAHRNESKGMALKVSDAMVAALCHKCHFELDNGKNMTREERRDMWNRAYIKTIQLFIERGWLMVVMP